jgi:hypothetical protein
MLSFFSDGSRLDSPGPVGNGVLSALLDQDGLKQREFPRWRGDEVGAEGLQHHQHH